MESMKQTLTEILLNGQAVATLKQGEEFNAMAMHLEGRTNRAREHQEIIRLINLICTDQLKFQSEIRSTLAGL